MVLVVSSPKISVPWEPPAPGSISAPGPPAPPRNQFLHIPKYHPLRNERVMLIKMKIADFTDLSWFFFFFFGSRFKGISHPIHPEGLTKRPCSLPAAPRLLGTDLANWLTSLMEQPFAPTQQLKPRNKIRVASSIEGIASPGGVGGFVLVSRAGQPSTRRWVSITQGSEQEGRVKKLPLGKKNVF